MDNKLLIFAELLGLFPAILFYIGKKKDRITVFFLPFILLVAVASLYEFVCTGIFKIGAKLWFRVYTFLEFFTVLYFYNKLLKYKFFYLLFAVIYLLIYSYLLIDWSPSQKGFNDLPLNIAMTLLVVISSLLWFVSVFKKLEDKPLYQRSDFFYISGLLIYFTGTFLVFLTADYLRDDPNYTILDYWFLIIIFNIILRTILIFTIWKARIK